MQDVLDTTCSYLKQGGGGKSCEDNKHLAENTEVGEKEKKKKKEVFHSPESNLVFRSLPSITRTILGTISSYQHGSPVPHEQGLPLPPPHTQVTKIRSPKFKGKGAKKQLSMEF